ncbi:MAG: HPr family phosphocarrier protein [Blautia sp.]|nr:HPr family phosphocarrier protein [Blautia sp.]
MVSKKVKVINYSGLHLRPAGILCKEAMSFSSNVTLKYNGGEANAKSVLSILGACVKMGDEVEIVCDGEDEDKALESVIKVISEGLGE